MSGWLRHLALNAQARTGFSVQIIAWSAIVVVAPAAALAFFCLAAFFWLADRYDPVIAGLALGFFFLLVALIAMAACLLVRRRSMERARLELAARRDANWLDPRLMAVGVQVGQAIGWRRLATLAAVALVAAGVAREWSGQGGARREDEEPHPGG